MPKFLIALFIAVAWSLHAQKNVQVSKGFTLPHYEKNQLRAVFTGVDARPLTGGLVLVTKFTMTTYKEGTNQIPELVVEAPECVFDRASFQASSSGPLKVYTAQTNLFIQGEGFLCQQTNMLLFISNKVETTILKTTLRGGTNALATSTNQGEKIFIYADRFEFLYRSNHVAYTGHVRVDEPDMGINSERLDIRLNTNGGIQSVIARTNVVLLSKQTQSRATGDEATYISTADTELVTLTGNPTWNDKTQGSGKAERFIYDRKKRIFRCETNAVLQLVNGNIAQPSLPLGGAGSPTQTNLIEIAAHIISIQLPATNGPVEQLIAETNVVIRDVANQSHATAARAIFRQTNGFLELTGDPEWTLGGKTKARGDRLVVENSGKEFKAFGNAFLQLPGNQGFAPGTNAETVLEIRSENYVLTTNRLSFFGGVQAASSSSSNALTILRSEELQVEVGPTNTIRSLHAREKVEFIQESFALLHSNKRVLNSDNLTLTRNPKTEEWESFTAEPRARLLEIQSSTNSLVTRTMTSGPLAGKFAPGTNRLEHLQARGGVSITDVRRRGTNEQTNLATGAQAILTTEQGVEIMDLTGNPIAEGGGIRIERATLLRWFPQTGEFRALGPYTIDPLPSAPPLQIK